MTEQLKSCPISRCRGKAVRDNPDAYNDWVKCSNPGCCMSIGRGVDYIAWQALPRRSNAAGEIAASLRHRAFQASSPTDSLLLEIADKVESLAGEECERCKELTTDNGLLKIALDSKKELLASCDAALAELDSRPDAPTSPLGEGLKLRYDIRKVDGIPCRGRYFVLKLDSKDSEHARACRQAIGTYARSILNGRTSACSHLVVLAKDILGGLQGWQSGDRWEQWDSRIGGPISGAATDTAREWEQLNAKADTLERVVDARIVALGIALERIEELERQRTAAVMRADKASSMFNSIMYDWSEQLVKLGCGLQEEFLDFVKRVIAERDSLGAGEVETLKTRLDVQCEAKDQVANTIRTKVRRLEKDLEFWKFRAKDRNELYRDALGERNEYNDRGKSVV